MDVRAIPAQEHLPWAQVWFHAIDDEAWGAASRRARELGKTGLEAWTTEATPEVVAYLEARGYEEVRRYLRFALDVEAAPDPGEPGWEVTTLADRPDLVDELFEVERNVVTDQPGRDDAVIDFDGWRAWVVDRNPHDAIVLALDDGRVVGFGWLSVEDDEAYHGMTGVLPEWRGRGVAEAIKRAHIRWTKANGIRTLRTANEVRITAIRRLNERYGYEPEPAEIVLRGPLRPS